MICHILVTFWLNDEKSSYWQTNNHPWWLSDTPFHPWPCPVLWQHRFYTATISKQHYLLWFCLKWSGSSYFHITAELHFASIFELYARARQLDMVEISATTSVKYSIFHISCEISWTKRDRSAGSIEFGEVWPFFSERKVWTTPKSSKNLLLSIKLSIALLLMLSWLLLVCWR